jgi:hypothetical protein
MKGIEIKTTLYDIFAYLVPGGLALCLLLTEHYRLVGVAKPLRFAFQRIGDVGFAQGLLILGLSYVVGHGMSTLSKLVLEDWFLEKNLSKHVTDEKLVGDTVLAELRERHKEVFGCNYEKKSFRAIIAYIEDRRRSIYGTAFVFLSFYGMARNISMLSFIAFIWYAFGLKLFGAGILPLAGGGSFLIAILFYYEYFRFHSYYHQHILMGFLSKEA